MNKIMLSVGVAGVVVSGAFAADSKLDIAFVDSFKAMRECKEGEKVAKELEGIREKISKEIQDEAKKVAQQEQELKSKAATLKKDALEKQERDLQKKRRSLEERVRDGEEELKMVMQQKTESLAAKVEESIVDVAKNKGVDVVIDKVTGRVLYAKDDNKGDITADTIAQVNKKAVSEGTTQVAAKKDDKSKATA